MDVKPLVTESRAELNAAENDYDAEDLEACHVHLKKARKLLNDFFELLTPTEPEAPSSMQ